MKPYMTDAEVDKKIKESIILCDTREQVNTNVTDWFDKHKIGYTRMGLHTGDYSIMLDGITYEDEVAIERKANIDEIAGNFTAQRQRFEDEFIRAKANGIKIFLVIENCSWKDILAHNYISKLKPQSLIGSLLAWQARYNITINFCKPDETAMLISGILRYWIRERIKR